MLMFRSGPAGRSRPRHVSSNSGSLARSRMSQRCRSSGTRHCLARVLLTRWRFGKAKSIGLTANRRNAEIPTRGDARAVGYFTAQSAGGGSEGRAFVVMDARPLTGFSSQRGRYHGCAAIIFLLSCRMRLRSRYSVPSRCGDRVLADWHPVRSGDFCCETDLLLEIALHDDLDRAALLAQFGSSPVRGACVIVIPIGMVGTDDQHG